MLKCGQNVVMLRNLTIFLYLFACNYVHSQCVPEFEKPVTVNPDEDYILNIQTADGSCSGCGKLLYSTDSLFGTPNVAERIQGEYAVKIHTAGLQLGSHKLFYRLMCTATIERGYIMLKVIGAEETREPFRLDVLDIDEFNSRKPFRIKVFADGFPQAMVTCAGCKDIEFVENNVYRIYPGYASEVELTVNGVSASGDFKEIAVRRLQFP